MGREGRGVVVKQRSLIIGIDESHRKDAELTQIAAVMIPERHYSGFDRKWTILRKRLKYHLLRSYPLAQGHRLLKDGGLPEIHAKEMFKSSGYYHKDANQHPAYWEDHWHYLDLAVDLIVTSRAQIFELGVTQKIVDWNINFHGLPSVTYASDIKSKNVKARMDALFSSRYVWGLNFLLAAIEKEYSVPRTICKVNCDIQEYGIRFENLLTYEKTAKHMGWVPYTTPLFLDSHGDSLIQAADVVAYVFGLIREALITMTLPHPRVLAWYLRLQNLTRPLPAFPAWQPIFARHLEVILRGGLRDSKRSADLDRAIEEFLEEMFKNEGQGSFLLKEGLPVYLPKMYKAPSEEGALSELIVPETEESEMYRPPSGDGDLSDQTVPKAAEEDKDEDTDSNGGQP